MDIDGPDRQEDAAGAGRSPKIGTAKLGITGQY